MKCLARVLSTASFVLLSTSSAAAQNTAPPVPPEGPPPPGAAAPAPVMPRAAPPSQAPPNLQPLANPSPAPQQAQPAAPYPQYPPYGYQQYPYGGMGWGGPSELPNELPYGGGPIPNGYQIEERYTIGLLIAGPTLFALAYAAGIFAAAEKGDSPSLQGRPWKALYVPITGPFAFSAYAAGGESFIYVFEGLAQVAGVGMFLGGILRPREILARKKNDAAYEPSLRVGPRSVQLEMRF